MPRSASSASAAPGAKASSFALFVVHGDIRNNYGAVTHKWTKEMLFVGTAQLRITWTLKNAYERSAYTFYLHSDARVSESYDNNQLSDWTA